MDAQMGSTGSGFLGLARGMAKYLYQHKIEKPLSRSLEMYCYLPDNWTFSNSTRKKNQYLFRGTYLPTYLTYLIQSSKNIEKKNPPSPAERATSTWFTI